MPCTACWRRAGSSEDSFCPLSLAGVGAGGLEGWCHVQNMLAPAPQINCPLHPSHRCPLPTPPQSAASGGALPGAIVRPALLCQLLLLLWRLRRLEAGEFADTARQGWLHWIACLLVECICRDWGVLVHKREGLQCGCDHPGPSRRPAFSIPRLAPPPRPCSVADLGAKRAAFLEQLQALASGAAAQDIREEARGWLLGDVFGLFGICLWPGPALLLLRRIR